MDITLETNKDVIVYALKKIISHTRNNHYIVLEQSVWWISPILGLQEELIIHIDNQKVREDIDKSELPVHSKESRIHPARVGRIQQNINKGIDSDSDDITSECASISTAETDIHNEVIDN